MSWLEQIKEDKFTLPLISGARTPFFFYTYIAKIQVQQLFYTSNSLGPLRNEDSNLDYAILSHSLVLPAEDGLQWTAQISHSHELTPVMNPISCISTSPYVIGYVSLENCD